MQGCLVFVIVCVLFGYFSTFFNTGKTDEFDTFIQDTQSKSDAPYPYIANKDSKEYCVNIEIRDSGSKLTTYCAQRLSNIEEYSKCYKWGVFNGHASEFMSTAIKYFEAYKGQISHAHADDLAKIAVCKKLYGKNIHIKDRNKIEKDVLDIQAEKEEAKELKVTYKCLTAYKINSNTEECSVEEIQNIDKKYKNIDKYYEEQTDEFEKEAREAAEARAPKEIELANKIGVTRTCLVAYENNYDFYSDREIYKILKDDCKKQELNELIDYFDKNPNDHLEELPNGY